MKKIIIATTNKGKLKEIKEIFKNLPFEFLWLSDFEKFPEIIEDGNSFEENAEKKAKTVFKQTGIPTIGDDSGLAVEQLNGRPGVFSARYAGENASYDLNNTKLLAELRDFPEPHKAKFICAAFFYDGQNEIVTKGEVDGRIIKSPRGVNGFGYDPVFLPHGFNQTLAELSSEVKNKISHRAKAFEGIKVILKRVMNV